MSSNLTFEHFYPVEADRLFSLAADLDALDAIGRPWIEFRHLPSGPVQAGQVIDVSLSVLGLFPELPYRMRVVICDPVRRVLRSEEDGMGIRFMSHDIAVTDVPGGARIVDRIAIEAGWRTPFVALCARILYRRRHRVRRHLLGLR
jgi:hypothetical protein